jgi:hypothetical protein
MRRLKKIGVALAVVVGIYILLPLVIFDFSAVATPYDEENFGSQQVAIGPKPWWWVPRAARHLDIPGGFDYDPSGWPFVVWKPLCVAYDKAHGYALPAEWR